MLSRHRDPLQTLVSLQRALKARRASDWLRDTTTSSGAFPPINMFRKGEDFVAVIELAGIDRTDLDIQAKDNTVRLAGKKVVDYPEAASTHRRERLVGSFDRTIQLPVRIDIDKVTAEYRDGILLLVIPREEDDKPKNVAIK